jgi:hypothetical protein
MNLFAAGASAREEVLGMARQGKLLPARRLRDPSRDESILLRSAESLGRMIGTLQRQLDDARHRFGDNGDASSDGSHDDGPRRPVRKANKTKATVSRAGKKKKTTAAKRSTRPAGKMKAAKRTRKSR